ncbi:GDSL-type esterase/lipase family protein [Flavobacteriaceae bacterium]|nr:GDSL-type esterase/lipase family protein [Flavobacteriaceae bacterium]
MKDNYFHLVFIFIFCFNLNLKAQNEVNEEIQIKVNEAIKTLDWGGLQKYEKANNELASKKDTDAVFIGDSITEGWSYYFSDFFNSNNYLNRGISGQTTEQMLLRFRRDVIDLNPKTTVILAGINDIAQNTKFYGIKVSAGNIFSMVELAQSHGIKPIICSVLPADRFNWNPSILPSDLVKEMNQLLRSYAEDNQIMYLDYHAAMNNNKGGLRSELTNDGVHVTREGYSLMNKMVKESIQKLLIKGN